MIADTVNQLSSKWWTFLLRGIVALALAAMCLMMPLLTAGALVYVAAAYFIVAGVVSVLAGFSFTGVGSWWLFVISGIVQAFLGFLMLSQPGMGPLALAYLFATWTIMTGVTEISSAIALRKVINNEFWWILLGIITLMAGAYVVIAPGLGLLALVYTVGFYAIFAGISLIALAFRLRGMAGNPQARHHATA
jgi:uncharacterized membrane protein HdeD (DUF308 family)